VQDLQRRKEAGGAERESIVRETENVKHGGSEQWQEETQ